MSMCVCVCVREREREREGVEFTSLYNEHLAEVSYSKDWGEGGGGGGGEHSD